MAQTEFSHPKGNRLSQVIWKTVLALMGWKAVGQYPKHPKSILLFFPHTSNWDFIFLILSLYTLGIKPNWMGKKELFFWPAKYIFTTLGGISVDRSHSISTVKATLQMFEDRDQILLGIAPEGTRRKSEYWKSGFYHIAKAANVPINFCYLNYKDKIGGVQEGFVPTGDIDKDMEKIRNFFTDFIPNAKYPNEVGEIKLKPKKSPVLEK